MAYKFTQNKTTDMTGLKSFLDNNRAGTFLENASIELSGDANDTLTITLGSAGIKFLADVTGTKQIVQYTGKYTSFSMSSSSKYGATNQYLHLITGAMLGTNALLLEYHGSYSSSVASAVCTKYPIMLTIDSSGDLAAVAYTGAMITNAVYNSFHVFACNSTFAPTAYAYPDFSAARTSLAQIVPYTDDPTITLPYVYAAIHTQVSGEGFTEISMNGKNYITNGYWYAEE